MRIHSLRRRAAQTVAVVAGVSITLLAIGATGAAAQGYPAADTTAATDVAPSSATLNGLVTPDSAATSYYFEYGAAPAYGSTTATLTAGSGDSAVPVSATVSGLTPGDTYYFQVVAFNSYGTVYGGEQSLLPTTTSVPAPVTVGINRVQGSDRYQTSAAIAMAKYPAGVPGGNVVLATGTNFPDALAGAYLAGRLGAPILLVPPTAADPAFPTVTSALAALHATTVYLLGGASAIGPDVQAVLASSYTVVRIGGTTRYDTMQMIDEQAGTTAGSGGSGSPTAIIATGDDYPDALAAGPLAWAKHLPIILTDGAQAALSPQTVAVIAALGITHFLVMGGSSAINPAQVTQLGSLGTVDQQFAGVDRTDTAALFAAYTQSTYGVPTSSVILAAGQNFPDALSAGPWGGDPSSIYLTETADALGPYTTEALEALQGSVSTIDVAGGTAVVDDNAAAAAEAAAQSPATTVPPTASTQAPVATTGAATGSTSVATLNGTVDPDGVPTTYYFEYGTTTSFGSVTPTENAGAGTTALPVTAYLTDVDPDVTYYFQLVADNAYGASYGGTQAFSGSNGLAPSAATSTATAVTGAGATLNGTVDPDGTGTTYYFEYGTTSALGAITRSQYAGPNAGPIDVSAALGRLAPRTTYYYQLVAYNAFGTTLGGIESVTTRRQGAG
jgi:putative cell wall-binding protein